MHQPALVSSHRRLIRRHYRHCISSARSLIVKWKPHRGQCDAILDRVLLPWRKLRYQANVCRKKAKDRKRKEEKQKKKKKEK